MRRRGSVPASVLLILLAAGSVAAAMAPVPADSTFFQPYLHEKPPPLPGGPAGPGAPGGPAATAAVDRDDPEPPRGTRGYDVLHYDLDLRLDVAGAAVSGSVAVDLRALAAPLVHVRLDLVEALRVASVTWTAGPGDPGPPTVPVPWTQGAESLAVDLPQPLPAGAAGRLVVTYAGRPPRHGAFAAGLLFRDYDGTPVVASMSEPWSAHAWWPCKDTPDDKATVRLAATVPDTLPWPLTVVGNGRLVEESAGEPGWRRFVWQEDYPIATYLVSLAASRYVGWSEDCPGAEVTVPLTFSVFPAKEAAARHDLAPTCEMVRMMEGVAGPWPFPGEKYAQTTFVWGGAMENQTATSLGAFLLTGDGHYEWGVIHELAHQWFGDSLGPARWRDIWLNEGFARYCEALWAEHVGGRDAYLQYLRQLGPQRHADLFVGDGLLADPAPILPNDMVYDKGAWVLHMLRGLVGDDAFFDLLRRWADDPARRHGTVTTEDFLAHVESVAGRQAADFLQPWLRRDAAPALSWRWWAVPAPGGRSQVRLELAQTQGEPFLLPLPVHLHGSAGEQVERALLARDRQDFTWTVAGTVDSLRVDPEGWLLWRGAETPPPGVRILAVRPNPAGPDGATVELALAAPAHLAARLYDARGRRLGAWDLGRLEPAAAAAAPLTWRLPAGDAGGRPLPAGVYWLELRAAGGGRAVTRLTLLR